MSEWLLRFDGLYEPRFTDRGIATYGFVAYRDGALVHEGRGLVLGPGSIASANVAEFGAMIQALSWLRERGIRDGDALRVEGDSRLAIETVAGRWNLSSPVLLPLRDAARGLLAALGGGTLAKVSREQNAEADRLSREAYHEAAAAHPEWGLGRSAHRRART